MKRSVQGNRILVIDDDREMRHSLQDLLQSAGWDVSVLDSAVHAEQHISKLEPHVVLSDIRMPKRSGLDFLHSYAAPDKAPVVLVSAHGDIPMAVEAIQSGAYSFLEKPFDPRRLLTVLANAAEQHRLVRSTTRLKSRLAELSGLNRLYMGDSPAIAAVRDQVIDLAGIDASVLLVGETGTGKELIAHALHDLSDRAAQPFVPVNCAAIPVAKFEELFFGQVGGPPGLIEQAGTGTLFLDEVAAAPVEAQAKLLRVVDTREFHRLGAVTANKVQARFVSAMNAPPQKAIAQGALREDLYFRLAQFEISLPSLRDLKDDIALLFNTFLRRSAEAYDMAPTPQQPDDYAALLAHGWPGNVRELRYLAERCVLGARRGQGHAAQALKDPAAQAAPQDLRNAVAAFERRLISDAIGRAEGRMDEVSVALGIGRRTLNEKIVKLNIDKESLLS